MQETDLKRLWKELIGDIDFFSTYKERFRENFLRFLGEEEPKFLGAQGLSALVDRLYLLMFSFQRDPREELFNLSYMLAKYEVQLNKVLNKACLMLARDYIDHSVSRNSNYGRIKLLLELIETYLSVAEDSYTKYVRELKEEIHKGESAVLENERRLALEFLEKLKSRGRDGIELLSYYKKVPVVCKSKLLSVRDEILKATMCNLDILRPGNEVYVKHADLPRPVAVKVADVDMKREEAVLEVLGFRDLPQERRRYLRVVPEEPIPVRLSKENREVVGNMADISVGGIGLYMEDVHGLKEGDTVRVIFTLPKGEVDTHASIKHITPFGDIYRVGLRYELDLRKEEVVSDYVMGRQFEILKELRRSPKYH